MEMLERCCELGLAGHYKKPKNKITQAVRSIDKDTLEHVYDRMENILFFVLREESGYFEHRMN